MLNFDTYEKLGLCVTSNDGRVSSLQICKDHVDIGIVFIGDRTSVSVNGFMLTELNQLEMLYRIESTPTSEIDLENGLTHTTPTDLTIDSKNDQTTQSNPHVSVFGSATDFVSGCVFNLHDNFTIKVEVNHIQDALTGKRAIPETIEYTTITVKPNKAKPYRLIIKHGSLTINDEPLNTVNLDTTTLKKLLENLVVK